MEFVEHIGDRMKAGEIAESCLTITDDDIPTYINAAFNTFIKEHEISFSKLADRFRAYWFLTHIKKEASLFNSNSKILMLNDRNIQKVKIIQEYIEYVILKYQKTGLILDEGT
jgi:hypothetical protein